MKKEDIMFDDNPEIKENDRVLVNFNNVQYTLCRKAKVLHVPCATGDSWQFEDLNTGDIHYVSEGCTVSKLAESIDVTF